MKKMIYVVFVLAIVLASCATVNKEVKAIIDEAAQQTQDAVTTSIHAPFKTYIVEQGDTLWAIAGEVYNDNFYWPALFKANRHFLINPDLIEIDQEILVKEITQYEKGAAKRQAKAWPPYKRRK